MRLKIKLQLTLVSLILSLLPILLTGWIAYQSARSALEERIRFNLESLASETLDKLERILLERQHDISEWAKLGFVQDDVVTGDVDNRIFQFLKDEKKNSELFHEIWVANAEGKIISSTLPALNGRIVRDRIWFQSTIQGKSWVGEPSLQDLTGRVGMPVAVPIMASFKKTQTVGVLVAVLDWDQVDRILNEVKLFPAGQSEKGYLVITDARGALLSYPKSLGAWEVGKTTVENLGLSEIRSLPTAGSARSAELRVRDQAYLVGYATTVTKSYFPSSWSVLLLMRSDVAFAPVRRLMWIVVGLSVILGAAAVSLSVYWANRFSQPITSLVSFLNAVASGDLSRSFSLQRSDELGMLAQAANEMSAKLREIIDQIQKAVLHITTATTKIFSATQEHASGSAQQAASIAQVTATMEELTTSAKQIAENAESVERIADESARFAHTGFQSVKEFLRSMDRIRQRTEDTAQKSLALGKHSQRIGEVLALIKEIAGEIHLLAINAAIESSAAGEHGKRFAVVASEVRRLAEKTREATEEIKGIVGEIQSATNQSTLATEQGLREVESGALVAKRTGTSLEEILQMVDRTTKAIRQITLATHQQRSGSEQIVQSMQEVAEITKQAAAGVKQSANSMAELNELADQLKARIREFKL